MLHTSLKLFKGPQTSISGCSWHVLYFLLSNPKPESRGRWSQLRDKPFSDSNKSSRHLSITYHFVAPTRWSLATRRQWLNLICTITPSKNAQNKHTGHLLQITFREPHNYCHKCYIQRLDMVGTRVLLKIIPLHGVSPHTSACQNSHEPFLQSISLKVKFTHLCVNHN